MKSVIVSLSVLAAMALGGCQTTQGLQTPDSELARRILANHCVVGIMSMGREMPIPVREGVVSKRGDGMELSFKHKHRVDEIFVYDVEGLPADWVVVEASSQRVRENLYFNRATGEFACTSDEWRSVRSNPMVRAFEVTPLILFNDKSGLSN